MALSVDIPKINITPEAEEDDDHIPLNLSEALTDVEDLFDDDQEPSIPLQKKSKLKIKLSNGDGGVTDLEDFEASSEDDEIKLIKHDNPVALSDLDLEAPITEESYKRQAKRAKGKKRTKTEFATKQKSFYHSLSEEEKSNDEGVATNSEGYETENDLNEIIIPETDFNLDLYKTENLVADNVTSDYSDSPLRIEDSAATDYEILRSDSDSENEVKRTKVRRRKHKGQRKPVASTDLEDLYFSDDEAMSKSVRREKRKPKQLLVKSNTIPFESENEDNATLPFPVCKQIAKKHPVSLRLPEFDTNFQTDVEDIEGDPDLENVETSLVNEAALEEKLKEISSCYGKVREEHKCIQKEYSYESARVESVDVLIDKEETDEDEFQSEGAEEIEMFSRDENIFYKIKFSPSSNCLKDNLSLPLNTDDPLTDWENVDSSPEEVASKKIPLALVERAHGFTDEEEFSDDNDVDSIAVSEIHLPPSTRNLVLIQENDAFVPTVRILPLDSLEISHRESLNFGDTTEEEIVSEAEVDLLNVDEPVRAPTPDLPFMDGGQVNVEEHVNKMRNSFIDCLTDTEDLILDNKLKRKRAPKFKFMYEKSKNDKKIILTDTEDVVLSDNCLTIPQIRNSSALMTDTEDIDFSGDDQDYRLRPLSVTPQHMRELGGETLLLKEGSGPFSIIDKLEVNKFTLYGPNKFVTPATTDSEDMMASAEEDLDHSATPNHIELDQMSAADAPEEVMYLKGGGYTDPQSDIEVMMFEGDKVENIAFDFENFSVAFECKEWDASKKPAEVPGQTSLDASAAQQAESVSLQPNRNNSPSAFHKTVSYTQIDAILDKMINEVEQQEQQLFSLDLDVLEPQCINTFELIPSSDALIEVPIKKSIKVPKKRVYETTQTIDIKQSDENPYELIAFGSSREEIQPEEHEYDLIRFDDPASVIEEANEVINIPVKGDEGQYLLEHIDDYVSNYTLEFSNKAAAASAESLNDSINDINDPEDHDYEPIDTQHQNDFDYQLHRNFADSSDIWWEGTYRNLSIVPEEDEENTSMLSSVYSSPTKYVSRPYPPLQIGDEREEKIPLVDSFDDDNDDESTSSLSSSADEATYDLTEEKVVKAEVKLMVKTVDKGRENIEIRSLREFMDDAKTSAKQHKQLKQKSQTLPSRLSETFFNIGHKVFGKKKTSTSHSSLLEQVADKDDVPKPTFTLPRLFVKTQEGNELLGSKELSKSKSELIATTNEKFPLEFDHASSLYANPPFYPVYDEFIDHHSSSPTLIHPSPAYCDWFSRSEDLLSKGEEQHSSSQAASSSAKAESQDDQDKPEKGKSKKVPDQHQLSDEMKHLLKEMEKDSKQ